MTSNMSTRERHAPQRVDQIVRAPASPRRQTTTDSSKPRHKEFRFPVAIGWDEGSLTTARVLGKQPVRIATPPEFRGANPDIWSPEDAFVAAAGSCLAVTIVAIAERQQLPLNGLSVQAEGFVGRRADGQFGFVRIEQTVRLETDGGHEEAAHNVVAKAEDGCLVTGSLDVPVHTRVEVRTAASRSR